MVSKETKGKSSVQVKEKAFVVGSNKVTNTGPKTQRNAIKVLGGTNGPKPKLNKSHKPTPGLIFGPRRTEEILSVSGKRMRVDDVTEGRAGGIFMANRDVVTTKNQPAQHMVEDNEVSTTVETRIGESGQEIDPPIPEEGSMAS